MSVGSKKKAKISVKILFFVDIRPCADVVDCSKVQYIARDWSSHSLT